MNLKLKFKSFFNHVTPWHFTVIRLFSLAYLFYSIISVVTGKTNHYSSVLLPLLLVLALWIPRPAGWIFLQAGLAVKSAWYGLLTVREKFVVLLNWSPDRSESNQQILYWLVLCIALAILAVYINKRKELFIKGEATFPQWQKTVAVLVGLSVFFLPGLGRSLERSFDFTLLQHPSEEVTQLVFSPDGKYIASRIFSVPFTYLKYVYIWDVNTHRLVHTFTGRSHLNSIAFSPDGKYLAAGRAIKQTIVDKSIQIDPNEVCIDIWDMNTGQMVDVFKRTSPSTYNANTVQEIAFSPDGKHLVAVTGDKFALEIWDIRTGLLVKTHTGYKGYTKTLTYSPDGKHITLGSSEGIIYIWDAETGELAKSLSKGVPGKIYSLAYSPDGKYIACSFNNRNTIKEGNVGSIEIWDVDAGELIRSMTWDSGEQVKELAYSADGKYIASEGTGVVRLWDSQTGRLVKVYKDVPSQSIRTIAFSPDGKLLASGGGKYIKLWKIEK